MTRQEWQLAFFKIQKMTSWFWHRWFSDELINRNAQGENINLVKVVIILIKDFLGHITCISFLNRKATINKSCTSKITKLIDTIFYINIIRFKIKMSYSLLVYKSQCISNLSKFPNQNKVWMWSMNYVKTYAGLL